MGVVVGIDLGTTNTVVGAVTAGQASALADESGRTLIPSVVSFHPNGSVLVGEDAKQRRRIDASNTVYSIKRLIGRSWDSSEVSQARSRFAFEMREGPGQAALVVARNETYTLPEISAFVLRRAKKVAEHALGEPVERAVITVPANFNDLQRAATKVAGRVAGLEVLRILNEPTAAALAYGYGKSSSERIAVYDFGGGTLDVTLLDLSDNVFEVLATAGDTFLGGDDIDAAIAGRMAEQLLATRRYDARSDPSAFERLRGAAEHLKVVLSSKVQSSVQLSEIAPGPRGRQIDFEFSMSRAELEALAAPIVERTFKVCEEALRVARLNIDDFSQVLLVGGSTRIPLVRSRVEEFFGQKPVSNLNPDEIVAIGAAIQANALSGAERRRSQVPNPPNPARRSTLPGRGSSRPPRKRQSTLPPGYRPQLRTNPLLDTSPGVREKTRTSPGLQPGSKGAPPVGRPAPVVAPPAAGQPMSAQPITRDRAGKQTTALGLGHAPPRPPLVTPDPKSGLGPPPPPPHSAPAETGNTLLSAEQERAEAERRLAARDSSDFAAKYGNLPLVMPEEPRARVGETTEDSVPTYHLDDADLEDVSDVVALGQLEEQERGPTGTEPLFDGEDEPTQIHTSRSEAPLAPVGLPQPGIPVTAPMAPNLPSPTQAGFLDPRMVVQPTPVIQQAPEAPLLIDVTPLTLAVETVGGYSDAIIERNNPIPCEKRRHFATVNDNQSAVRVRVSQGESQQFADNTLLGEVVLGGLRAAPRGKVKVEVAFALDASGMLNVNARDLDTGRSVSAQIRLVGLAEAVNLDAMRARHVAAPMG